MESIKQTVEPKSVRDARKAAHDAKQAALAEDKAIKDARKNIPNQGGGLPQVRAELDALKQTLLDQGILTGI